MALSLVACDAYGRCQGFFGRDVVLRRTVVFLSIKAQQHSMNCMSRCLRRTALTLQTECSRFAHAYATLRRMTGLAPVRLTNEMGANLLLLSHMKNGKRKNMCVQRQDMVGLLTTGCVVTRPTKTGWKGRVYC